MSEIDAIVSRYERRKQAGLELGQSIYSPLRRDVYLTAQEKERAFIRWIRECSIEPVVDRQLLEIGCGHGDDLLRLINLGFRPENLIANELLPERAEVARSRLPEAVRFFRGDATQLPLPPESVDIVYQSMIFTSILDDVFQENLADKLWEVVRPGGGILWYDFVFNNPFNRDVRGVPRERLKELFPEAEIHSWTLTLAPPLARALCRFGEFPHSVFNRVPGFRTHILCWLRKPGAANVSATLLDELTGGVRKMTPDDIYAVVTIHMRAFKTFFLTFLGRQFLSEMYIGLLKEADPLAFVYVAPGGRVLGFVAGTPRPRGIYFRILLRRIRKLILLAAKGRFWSTRLLSRLQDAGRSYRHSDAALLMSLAVMPKRQGFGAGRALVHAFLNAARGTGAKHVELTTDADSNDKTNRFYQDLGFHLTETYTTSEKRRMNRYSIACEGSEAELDLPNALAERANLSATS